MTDNMQALHFNNLAQRLLYRYEFCLSDFNIIDSKDVSIESQEKFYNVYKEMIHNLYIDPSILGISIDDIDEYFNAHECMNQRPDFAKKSKKIYNEAYEFFNLLFLSGLLGECKEGKIIVDFNNNRLKIKPNQIKCLEYFNFRVEKEKDIVSFSYPNQPDIIAAWKLLAMKCNEKTNGLQCFVHYVHNNDYTYLLEHIRKLLGLENDFFNYIKTKYLSNGYEISITDDFYRMNYIFKKDVGGLNIEFSLLWPTIRFLNSTCIGIKSALEHADELNSEIKQQLIKFCKPCNECMGCTKGGKNKPFTVTVNNNSNEYHLCPEFVQMEWYNKDISKEKIDFIFELNELQEKFGKNWSRKK